MFCKCDFLSFFIWAVERITNRISKTIFHTLLPEIFRHLHQFLWTSAKGSSIFLIAVAYQKMCMNMVGIRMNCKQHFISFAPKELSCKLLCHLICFCVTQFIVVFWMNGNGYFLCQNLFRLVSWIFLLVHFSCNNQTVSKIITITAKCIVKLIAGLFDTSFYLLFSFSQNIIRSTF